MKQQAGHSVRPAAFGEILNGATEHLANTPIFRILSENWETDLWF